jgi:hypothetical protein
MHSRRWQTALLGVVVLAVGCARGALNLDEEPLPADGSGDGGAWSGDGDSADAGRLDPSDDHPGPSGDGDGDDPTMSDAPDASDPPGPPKPDAGPPDLPADSGPPVSTECQPGTYVGSFSGKITALFVVNINITGDISIDALTAAGGDVLTIDHGKVTGSDSDGNPVTADVTGTLDCATKQLMNGALSNGVYTRKIINQTVNFAGTVQAVYAPGNPPAVSGVWQTSGGVEMGSGNFNAVLRP